MATEGTFSTAPRVVILSRDHTLARAELEELCSRGMQCLRWSSAYEVAAELLSGTVDALVLDLRMLTGRNTRVLQIARERGVEVLAVGMLPASVSTENLSGVRLAGMRDLPGILQQLGTYLPVEPEQPPQPPTPEPTEPAEGEASRAHRGTAGHPDARGVVRPSGERTVTGGGNMLVLAEPGIGEELVAQVGRDKVVHHVDPYDALTDLSVGKWSGVVMTAPRGDFAGLCRAARRLQRDAKLWALCPPLAEPEVRPLVDGPLDDYIIYPPTQRDLSSLRAALSEPEAHPAGPTAPAALGGKTLSKLIDSTRSMATLEGCLAEVVGAEMGVPVKWVDAARITVPAGPAAPPSASSEAVLTELQQCVPALIETAKRTGSLHRLAITDHLTGAYNRRYFYHLTDQILLRARQRKFRVTLLLYDIDDFKRYNDTYGHAAGDEILRETAQLMAQITRAHDVVARIGGDEFCVLFWDAEKPRAEGSRPPENAFALADRFRRAVHTHEFPQLGPEARGALTISGGLASFPWDGRTCRELLHRADQALQAAKDSGKNAIHLVGGNGPQSD